MRLGIMRSFTAVIAFVLVVPLGFITASAAPIPINLIVEDGPGEGFNDPVLGPARLSAMRFAADLWGSFFERTFPTQVIDVGITFDPLTHLAENAVAIASSPRGFPFVGASFVSTLPHIESILGRRVVLSGNRISRIAFDSTEDLFLGTSGNPGKLDLVTFALHELGHLFGFITQLAPDGSYTGGVPSFYDFCVVNQNADALVNLSSLERIAAATSGDGLFWFCEQGLEGNDGIAPNLSAGTIFDPLVNVVHLSETFGPDLLMDPNKAPGEVIHTLVGVERGMFADLGWTLAPVQTVPEPPIGFLVLAGAAAIVCSRKRLLRVGW